MQAVVRGGVKNIADAQTGSKSVFDPHDILTIDVLSHLSHERKIYRSPEIEAAPHGAIIKTSGTIIFFDRSVTDAALDVMEEEIKQERRKPKKQQNEQALHIVNLGITVMKRMATPSAFLMNTDNGLRLAGTLKESGMEEPISTYHFKHGAAGLSGVHTIGIKESVFQSANEAGSVFFSSTQQVSDALMTLVIPADAIRLTPLAMFREL